MASMFSRITFEDTFQRLEKTRLWLESIGIQTQGTRFDEVFYLNRQILESHKNDLLKDVIAKYGNLKLWLALTDAFSFIEIYEAFKDQKSHVLPRRKLKMVLQGPCHSWDEDVNAGNIEPRNTLFELETASIFKKAGAKITGFDDVDFVFENTRFNVQCKRIHSERRMRDNVSEAAQQFYKTMKKAKSNLKGVICLSIDKLTGREKMILKVGSVHEIGHELTALLDSVLAKHRSLWHVVVNTNILAVLLFVHVVTIVEEHPYGLLTTCREIAFDVIPHQTFYQLADYNIAVKLGQRLQRAIESQ